MKKNYVAPSIYVGFIPVAECILEGSYTPPKDGVPGGGTIDDDTYEIPEARRRNNYSSRDEMVGGWRRGGLW